MSIKLSVTTLGCPEWDMETILKRVAEYGYQGIDFRGYLADVDLRQSPAFTSGRAETAARVRDSGLLVSCLASSAKMFESTAEKRQASLDEMKGYVEMCADFGAPFVRIFGGALGGVSMEAAMPIAADMLQQAAAIARDAGITIVVETHDDWVATKPLREAFDLAGNPEGVAFLWDVNHPYRSAGETPIESFKNIGRMTRYTHWKDSRLTPEGKTEHCLVGEGGLPLKEIYQLLRDSGYDGWYTLEWEKRWHRDLAEPEIAFPGYVKTMRAIAAG